MTYAVPDQIDYCPGCQVHLADRCKQACVARYPNHRRRKLPGAYMGKGWAFVLETTTGEYSTVWDKYTAHPEHPFDRAYNAARITAQMRNVAGGAWVPVHAKAGARLFFVVQTPRQNLGYDEPDPGKGLAGRVARGTA